MFSHGSSVEPDSEDPDLLSDNSNSHELYDKSGSCGNIVMKIGKDRCKNVVDEKFYIGNVGDSRSILSVNGG
jgi:serine/threonine protein phosphatase PrpC